MTARSSPERARAAGGRYRAEGAHQDGWRGGIGQDDERRTGAVSYRRRANLRQGLAGKLPGQIWRSMGDQLAGDSANIHRDQFSIRLNRAGLPAISDQAAVDVEPALLIQPQGRSVLLDDLQGQRAVAARAGLSKQPGDTPRADASTARGGDDAHAGQTAGPAAAGDEGQADRLVRLEDHLAQRKVQAVLANHAQQSSGRDLHRDKIIGKALSANLRGEVKPAVGDGL